MAVQGKRFSGFRSSNYWQRMQALRKRRIAIREDFENAAATLANGIGAAQNGVINGTSELALQAAAKRVHDATQAKIAQLVDKKA